MKTILLIIFAICANVTFTLAKAQLTRSEVVARDKTLELWQAHYPENIQLIRHQSFCILSPTSFEEAQDLITEKYYVRTVKSIHVKNRYTKREFKNIGIKVGIHKTITNDDAYTASVGFAWTVVVPIGTWIAKSITDAQDASKASDEVYGVLQDLYSNSSNLCKNLENNGDLNLEDLPE